MKVKQAKETIDNIRLSVAEDKPIEVQLRSLLEGFKQARDNVDTVFVNPNPQYAQENKNLRVSIADTYKQLEAERKKYKTLVKRIKRAKKRNAACITVRIRPNMTAEKLWRECKRGDGVSVHKIEHLMQAFILHLSGNLSSGNLAAMIAAFIANTCSNSLDMKQSEIRKHISILADALDHQSEVMYAIGDNEDDECTCEECTCDTDDEEMNYCEECKFIYGDDEDETCLCDKEGE